MPTHRWGRKAGVTRVADLDYDAVVVGSGAGGGIAAMVLCEAGLDVLLLERGRRYDFRTDYPMSHADWERRGDPFVEAGHETVKVESGAPLDRGRPRLFSGTTNLRRLRSAFHYRRVLGLGGTTLHYQGEAHRFADYAFRSASAYGFGVDGNVRRNRTMNGWNVCWGSRVSPATPSSRPGARSRRRRIRSPRRAGWLERAPMRSAGVCSTIPWRSPRGPWTGAHRAVTPAAAPAAASSAPNPAWMSAPAPAHSGRVVWPSKPVPGSSG